MAYERPLPPPIDPWALYIRSDPLPEYDQVSLTSYFESEVYSLKDTVGDVSKDVKSLLTKPNPSIELGIDELKSDVRDIKRLIEDDSDGAKRQLVELIKLHEKSRQYADEEWREFFLPIMRTLERKIKQRIFTVIEDKLNCERQLKGSDEDFKTSFDLETEMDELEKRAVLMFFSQTIEELRQYESRRDYQPQAYHDMKKLQKNLAVLRTEIERRLRFLEYKEKPICLYYNLSSRGNSNTFAYGYNQLYLITTKRIISITPKSGGNYQLEIFSEISRMLTPSIVDNGGRGPDTFDYELLLKKLVLEKDKLKEILEKYGSYLFSQSSGFTIDQIDEYSTGRQRWEIGKLPRGLYWFLTNLYSGLGLNSSLITNPLLYTAGAGQGAITPTLVISFTSYVIYKFDTPLLQPQILILQNMSKVATSTWHSRKTLNCNGSYETYTHNAISGGSYQERATFKAVITSIPGTYYAPLSEKWREELTAEGSVYMNQETGEISNEPPYQMPPIHFPK